MHSLIWKLYWKINWLHIYVNWNFYQSKIFSIYFSYYCLTPKIPWDQKLVDCCLGSLCEDFLFSFQFSLFDEWTTYFTSFLWTPSTSNFDSVWARGKFLLKTSIKLIFHEFSKELLHAAMWLKLPKGW
jgi:hypothetical protein